MIFFYAGFEAALAGKDIRYGYNEWCNNIIKGGVKLKEFIVYGHTTLSCSMRVEANSGEEAIEIANDTFGGLTNYAGMGSCDCLVGVLTSEDERSIYPDSEVEFDDYEEV